MAPQLVQQPITVTLPWETEEEQQWATNNISNEAENNIDCWDFFSLDQNDETDMMDSDFSLNVHLDKLRSALDKDTSAFDDDDESLCCDVSSGQKQLRFSQQNEINIIPNDLNEEEIRNAWYNVEEYNKMREECAFTLFRMVNNCSLTKHNLTPRGLESKLPQIYQVRQSTKEQFRNAILDEQQLQQEHGFYDPEWLAELSSKHSQPSVQTAIMAAFRDAQEALDCSFD